MGLGYNTIERYQWETMEEIESFIKENKGQVPYPEIYALSSALEDVMHKAFPFASLEDDEPKDWPLRKQSEI